MSEIDDKMRADLLRRRMAITKARALYEDAEAKANLAEMMANRTYVAPGQAKNARAEAAAMMAAADHILRTEIIET